MSPCSKRKSCGIVPHTFKLWNFLLHNIGIIFTPNLNLYIHRHTQDHLQEKRNKFMFMQMSGFLFKGYANSGTRIALSRLPLRFEFYSPLRSGRHSLWWLDSLKAINMTHYMMPIMESQRNFHPLERKSKIQTMYYLG